MSTPGGKELHQPHVLTVEHQLVKVALRQLNHVLVRPAAAGTAARSATLQPQDRQSQELSLFHNSALTGPDNFKQAIPVQDT